MSSIRTNITKVNSEYYVPMVNQPSLEESKPFNIENILLCQYDILDVASHIIHRAPTAKILVHNFANNEEPCGGRWESNLPENQIYNRTNLRQLTMPNRNKLYPIQDEFADNGVNIIIAENCQILVSSENKQFADPVHVDIASLDAVIAPQEKNLDVYNNQKYPRYDYADQAERDQVEARISFLIDYALGEGYDYLLTGTWALGQEMNPHWGLIQLWNEKFKNMAASKLRIIFCVPLSEETEYDYTYFNTYLVGQNHTLTLSKLKEDRKKNKLIERLSDGELAIKRKTYGLVWGMAFGEMLSNYLLSNDQKAIDQSSRVQFEQGQSAIINSSTKWIITNSEYTLDWDTCTDRTILLARSLSECDMDIKLKVFAAKLVQWKSEGFPELSEHSLTCQDKMTKHILSQPKYVSDPIGTANAVYVNKGSNDLSDIAIGATALNGVFKDYFRRTQLYTAMLQPDTACRAACLVMSFIVNSLWNNKYITTQDWGALINQCNKIFDSNQQSCVQHKLLFDQYTSIARNYQYQITGGLSAYLKVHLQTQYNSQSHTFLPMALAMILMYDIQGYICINKRPIRGMLTITDIPIIDDYMRENKADFNKYLPADYYFKTIETVSAIFPSPTCMAVSGSIIGLACWDNVYDDKVLKGVDGVHVNTDSQIWIKYADNAEWLNSELDSFIDEYIKKRRQVFLENYTKSGKSPELVTKK